MALNLVVGDVHVTPDELDDCEALLELVAKTAKEFKVDAVTFLGDQYNTHDIVNTRVIEFWRRRFIELKKTYNVIALRGNHDMVTPTQAYPHSMLAHPEVFVVDAPVALPGLSGVMAVPFYPTAEEFLNAANSLDLIFNSHTLFCHQTLQGAKYENGFFAPDGADVSRLPQKHIVSGHIHTPQTAGRAIYLGAPRWRSRSDANINRFITVMEHAESGSRMVERIPTGDVCRRLWEVADRPDAPFTAGKIPNYSRTKDKLYIDVYGPDEATVRAREAELKAEFGAVTRGFPERTKYSGVTEAEGIGPAFQKFASKFQPPNGTPVTELLSMVENRLVL